MNFKQTNQTNQIVRETCCRRRFVSVICWGICWFLRILWICCGICCFFCGFVRFFCGFCSCLTDLAVVCRIWQCFAGFYSFFADVEVFVWGFGSCLTDVVVLGGVGSLFADFTRGHTQSPGYVDLNPLNQQSKNPIS